MMLLPWVLGTKHLHGLFSLLGYLCWQQISLWRCSVSAGKQQAARSVHGAPGTLHMVLMAPLCQAPAPGESLFSFGILNSRDKVLFLCSAWAFTGAGLGAAAAASLPCWCHGAS